MQLKKGTEIEVEIKYLNISGRGVAKQILDNQEYSIAVPGLFPGDKAIISLTKIKKNYAEGKLVRITEKSPIRITPRSKHAKISGGSPWQVIDYDMQLEFKQKEVERILNNVNSDAEIKPIIGMKDPWFYRNKMQYSFGYDQNMSKTVGLHVAGRKFDVYDLEECFLFEPWAADVVAWFRQECFEQANLLPYKFKTGEHELRDLTIRSSKATKEAMLILSVSENANLDKIKKVVQKASQELEQINSFYLEQVQVKKGRRTERKLIHIAGPKTITEKIKDLDFQIGPTSFFQPNTKQAEVIYDQVAQLAKLTGQETVYDLFCGTGTIGLTLAKQTKHVYGLDIVEESIQMAQKNAKLNDLQNTTYLATDIFKGLPDWPNPDLIVVDPPRAGLQPNLIEATTKLDPAKIIYVSCNIKSFTHDLLEFRNHGWVLKTIQPVDQFPHTRHLETVALLEKVD